MKHGGFVSQNLLDDALTIAIIESGVALRAFDADGSRGGSGSARRDAGEELEGRPGELPRRHPGDRRRARPLALLFGATAAGRGVQPRDQADPARGVQVGGVPEIAVEEALWLAADVLRS